MLRIRISCDVVKKKSFRITVVQTSPIFLNRERNLHDIKQRLSRLSGDLFVLPELCTSGYNFRTASEARRCAEPVGGPTTDLLSELAKKKSCAIVAGFPELSGKKLYNSALIITPTQARAYRKIHLFWNEKRFFKAGRSLLPPFSWNGARIGVMICFDWIFPECARTLSLRGADVLAHPSNLVLPWAPKGMTIRSLENGVFSATANRVGKEGKLRYIGSSQVIGPRGEILARLSSRQPESTSVDVNLADAQNKRITPRNDLFGDRRPSLYI
jgi:predicted amidohydrolase